MSDSWFNTDIEPVAHEEDARRNVLDFETERTLNAQMPDGRQPVVEPPVGTIGGPMKPPGDDVTTTQTRTIPSGGGPSDARRMPDAGDRPTHTLGRSEDSGIGASPDPK